MLIYNLDERKLYITDRNITGEIQKGYEIDPSDILMYLNDEIEFQGEKETTLRDLRSFIVNHPLLITIQPDVEDFLKSTNNIGFINPNNKRSKALYLFKINRIEKSEAKLLDVQANKNNLFADVLEYTYIKKRNVVIHKYCYLFSQHPLVEINDAILKEEFISNYNGLGLNNLDYLMDLSFKDIFDVPLIIKEYLFESYIKAEDRNGKIVLKDPEESIEEVEEKTLNLYELLNLLASVVQTEIMLEEDFTDEEIDFELFDSPSERFNGLKLVENKEDNIISFPIKKDEKDS